MLLEIGDITPGIAASRLGGVDSSTAPTASAVALLQPIVVMEGAPDHQDGRSVTPFEGPAVAGGESAGDTVAWVSHDGKSWVLGRFDLVTLSDDDQSRVGDREAFAIGLFVNTDLDSIRHHNVLVDDRSADHGIATDVDTLE